MPKATRKPTTPEVRPAKPETAGNVVSLWPEPKLESTDDIVREVQGRLHRRLILLAVQNPALPAANRRALRVCRGVGQPD